MRIVSDNIRRENQNKFYFQ